MNKNRLIIAGAGSGKTTFLIKDALEQPIDDNVLITTYTEANEVEIKKKLFKIRGYIPSNIIVQTWFSFLIKHGIKPFQGVLHDRLFDDDINGMLLVNARSGFRFKGAKGPVYFGEGKHFDKFYFSNSGKLYSDKLSKFVVRCDKEASQAVFSRISMIFKHIYIDEIQDLAGYDLEVIKSLFKTASSVLLVGDHLPFVFNVCGFQINDPQPIHAIFILPPIFSLIIKFYFDNLIVHIVFIYPLF